MDEQTVGLIVLTGLTLTGAGLMRRGAVRSAEDVLRDLSEADSDEGDESQLARHARAQLSDPLTKAGLFTEQERSDFTRRGRLFPLIGAAVGVLAKLLLVPGDLSLLCILGLMGLAAGYLVAQSRLRRRTAEYTQALEFYLPVVMERLVMAVQSGLDILAALGAIIELERSALGGDERRFDPITRLFAVVHRLAERGLTFGQALEEVAAGVECGAVRHCFIHLAVAHEEGGELVMPLKELSDSTQLYYQESVDEQIAKLPVKATLPLLCTFSGLILFFLTSPLMQLMKLANTSIGSMH